MADGKYLDGVIPTVRHFAIIKNRFITVPGDQRSRDEPGHGFPESREEAITYQAYGEGATGRGLWEAEIRRLKDRNMSFTAALVIPAKVETQVAVTVAE